MILCHKKEKKMKKGKLVFSIFLILCLCTGCLKKDNLEGIEVVTTAYPYEYIANYLYGSHSLALKTNIKENFKKLQEKVQDYDYIWSNIDIITGDKIPLIGEIAKDFFIATGYNTWGMTNSTLASLIVKDLILEKENKYKEMTSPIRNSGSSIIKALFASLKTFSEELFFNNKDWYDGRITREKRNNTEVFVYKDDKGKEHIVKTKCPHLKCGLIFNEIEQTWDCPCHGSRFDIDGHCIEGPSNYNITYSPKDR